VPVTFYNKHLSFLHPFQMIAFEDTPAYLDRLQGGKQYVAVLDCREAPDPLLLVRICQHFTKIILLNATHHDINLWDIPFPLRTALRKKMIAFSEGV